MDKPFATLKEILEKALQMPYQKKEEKRNKDKGKTLSENKTRNNFIKE